MIEERNCYNCVYFKETNAGYGECETILENIVVQIEDGYTITNIEVAPWFGCINFRLKMEEA